MYEVTPDRTKKQRWHTPRTWRRCAYVNVTPLPLNFEDANGKVWWFWYSYWNSSQIAIIAIFYVVYFYIFFGDHQSQENEDRQGWVVAMSFNTWI